MQGADRLVLVHGFTQTARCWGPVDVALAERHEVVALDAPGHGTAADERADLWQAAGLLAGRGGRGTWIGYSMGGRMALHVALAHPEVVDRLVLIGATPGIEDPGARAERRDADEARAAHLEAIGVPAFLDGWLALPLFAGLDPDRAHRTEREANTAAGLASSLRLAGTGTQDPLWDRLRELTCPTLLVTGAADDRFTFTAARMLPRLGGPAVHATLPFAGHTAHLEQPEAFVAAVEHWLAAGTGPAVDPGGRGADAPSAPPSRG